MIGFFICPTQIQAAQGELRAAGICGGPIKKPIAQKNHVITIIITIIIHWILKTYLLLLYNYSIGLHVYAETNHLAKYHSSPFFIQVSAA